MSPLKMVSALIKKGVTKKGNRLGSMTETPTGEMSILSHLKELRGHIVKSLYWFVGFSAISFFYMDELLKFLRWPFEAYMKEKGKSPELISLGLFEVVMMNFKICLMVAFTAAIPFMIRELWAFVAPALYEAEKKFVKPLMIGSIFLFYIGVAFGFFVIVPAFLSSTIDWASQYANVQLTVESYFSSLTTMVVTFGIIFEVPVVMSLLGLAGILKSEMLSKNRKIVIFVSILVGTLLSPPDVFSQAVVSLPLYGMMEISILILKIIEKRRVESNTVDAP